MKVHVGRRLLGLPASSIFLDTREHILLFDLSALVPAPLDLGLIHLNHFFIVKILFLAGVRTRMTCTLGGCLLVRVVAVIPKE